MLGAFAHEIDFPKAIGFPAKTRALKS